MTSSHRKHLVAAIMSAVLGLSPVVAAHADESREALAKINHIVVIYQENHSFDNLYGEWEGVNGLANARVAQVNQAGIAFACLPQNDVNLTSPPLPESCTDAANGIKSYFVNAPFRIDEFIAATDTTCPYPDEQAANGRPKGQGQSGGCTEDIVHHFYQEQYQIHGGKMDRYVVGSDAIGLAMGHYDTKKLPIYTYLHDTNHPHPRYVIADNFFQAAFGGSFLNHQWLIAANTPEWKDAYNDGSPLDQHSVVDANGMPINYPNYTSPVGATVKDLALTTSCAPASSRAPTPVGVVCGDYVVNSIQPMVWPYKPLKQGKGQDEYDRMRLPSLPHPTIGDRLSDAGKDWAWYSGGWANAEGALDQPGYTNGKGPVCGNNALKDSTWPKCPDKLFQFHHQPFNYFANYAPGSDARKKHLRDEEEFFQLAKDKSHDLCNLKPVSFVKPLGSENEHPGYASEKTGNDHLVKLIKAIEENSACAKDTMIIVTYDEFGGQADHVAPPSSNNATGPYDQWGPGTRIPTLIIAPNLRNEFAVDHEVHDTTSILATIEHRFGLAPLGNRDAAVKDLTTAFNAKDVIR